MTGGEGGTVRRERGEDGGEGVGVPGASLAACLVTIHCDITPPATQRGR